MRTLLAGSLWAAVVGTLAGPLGPTPLAGQAPVVGSPPSGAHRLSSLSRERAARWAKTAPVIHCGPAPLTERPTASAEFARPSVLPLESAFLDATTVKRTFAARSVAASAKAR